MADATSFGAVLDRGRPVDDHHPWPRVWVGEDGWRAATAQVAAGEVALLALFGEAGAVHMALLDEAVGELVVISLRCRERFPSVSLAHPPAARLERAICDLFGLAAEGAIDARPWLDHGV